MTWLRFRLLSLHSNVTVITCISTGIHDLWLLYALCFFLEMIYYVNQDHQRMDILAGLGTRRMDSCTA